MTGICVIAQNNPLDTISIEKKILGADLEFKGKGLSIMNLEEMCKPFPDAMDEIALVKKNNNPAIFLTLIGAGLIGFTAIKWLTGDETSWYYAAGGAALIAVTIPLYKGVCNHSVNAAQIYNYEIRHLPKKP